jgi:hypothetical protein
VHRHCVYFLISGDFWSGPEIACDEIVACAVGPFEETAEPSVFGVCG